MRYLRVMAALVLGVAVIGPAGEAAAGELSSEPAGGEPIAYVGDVSGAALVAAADGKQVAAHTGLGLAAGDRLRLEAASRAILYRVGDGSVEYWSGGGSEPPEGPASVRALGLPDAARTRIREGLRRWGYWPEVETLPPENEGVRGMLSLLSPRNEIVLSAKPTFRWTGAKLKLRLKVANGEKLEYLTWRIKGSWIRYPPHGNTLVPDGRYEWWIEEFGRGHRPDITVPTFFRVASLSIQAEAAEVAVILQSLEDEGAPYLANLLRVAYFSALGAWSHALVAAAYLPEEGRAGYLARSAVVGIRERMDLTRDEAIYLLELLVWKKRDM